MTRKVKVLNRLLFSVSCSKTKKCGQLVDDDEE